MGTRIEHRGQLSAAPSVVYPVLISAEYLRARLEALGGEHAQLLEHEVTSTPATYHIRHGVPAEKLPSAARSLLGGDLTVDRTESWLPSGDGYRNTIEASIPGMPGEINAQMWLGADEDGSELRTTGEVTISVPVVGTKLERTVAEQVTKLLTAEIDFTAKWLADS